LGVVYQEMAGISPGHCAQYSTYTLMDEKDHDILVITNKRCVALKSTNMEAVGLGEAQEQLIIGEGLQVKEVMTDTSAENAK